MKKFSRRPPNDDVMNSFLDLDDRSSSPIERLSNKEAKWQHEAKPFIPTKRRFFPRNNGLSFNTAEVSSKSESVGESSDPLHLGYRSLQSLFCIFILSPL